MSMDKNKSENKIVINQYRSLMRIINSDINLDEKMIRSAFNLAIKAHNSHVENPVNYLLLIQYPLQKL